MKKMIALTLALMLMILTAAAAFADEKLDFSYATWVDGFTDEGLALYHARNGMYGYVNTDGEIAIPAMFIDARSFSEGLACVCVNGLYGFINTKGEIVIECKWNSAESFSEGVAAVRSGDLWGFIDATGAVVIQPAYTKVGSCQNGCIEVGYGGEVIDLTGAPVTRKYESETIFRVGTRVTGGYTKTYEYELRANGHVIATTSVYDSSSYAGYTMDLITRVENTGSLWRITERSKTAFGYSSNYILYDAAADKILMHDMDYIATTMTDGLIAVCDDSVGYYVNEKGVMEIPPVGVEVNPFVDGVALIKVVDGVYVFMDTQGVIIGSFDYAYEMNNGFSIVKEDGVWHVINSQCEKVN
ncbi:MAG: WG repeat-containing protein [Clostridia bacterium]|nr:WG repeat-containing protein [Clostridia bacterium]